MSERLLSYLYQFGLGGAVYLACLLGLLGAGALGTDPRVRRRRVLFFFLLFAVYAVGQGVLQFAGPAVPPGGGAP